MDDGVWNKKQEDRSDDLDRDIVSQALDLLQQKGSHSSPQHESASLPQVELENRHQRPSSSSACVETIIKPIKPIDPVYMCTAPIKPDPDFERMKCVDTIIKPIDPIYGCTAPIKPWPIKPIDPIYACTVPIKPEPIKPINPIAPIKPRINENCV